MERAGKDREGSDWAARLGFRMDLKALKEKGQFGRRIWGKSSMTEAFYLSLLKAVTIKDQVFGYTIKWPSSG